MTELKSINTSSFGTYAKTTGISLLLTSAVLTLGNPARAQELGESENEAELVVETESGTIEDRPSTLRLRLGTGYAQRWRYSYDEQQADDHTHGLMFGGEVAVGGMFTPYFGLYGSAAFRFDSFPDSVAPNGSKEATFGFSALVGPQLLFALGQTGLELDITTGFAVMWYEQIFDDSNHPGVGYAIALSYGFEVNDRPLGVFVKWEHSRHGSLIPRATELAYSEIDLGIGMQIWF